MFGQQCLGGLQGRMQVDPHDVIESVSRSISPSTLWAHQADVIHQSVELVSAGQIRQYFLSQAPGRSGPSGNNMPGKLRSGDKRAMPDHPVPTRGPDARPPLSGANAFAGAGDEKGTSGHCKLLRTEHAAGVGRAATRKGQATRIATPASTLLSRLRTLSVIRVDLGVNESRSHPDR